MISPDYCGTSDLRFSNSAQDDADPIFQMLNLGTKVDSDILAGAYQGVTHSLLLNMYREMSIARAVDTAAISLQRQGELSLWASSRGQEAAQVGSILAMNDSDMVFPSFREHAAALTRGIAPADLLAMWRGETHGGWDPSQHSFALYSIVIASQVLHAAGYALSHRLGGQTGGDDGKVVLVYFGDGAMSQGELSEALVWAASFEVPVVFFCQNNQWSISAPVSTQSQIPLYRRGHGYGIPSIRIDGNDAVACFLATSLAASCARSGQGPFLIEAITYRLASHTTADDDTKYRDRAEVEAWSERDPIDRLRRFLVENSVTDDGFFDEVQDEASEVVVALREDVKSMDYFGDRSTAMDLGA